MKESPDFTDEEIDKRRDTVVRRMLATPPQPRGDRKSLSGEDVAQGAAKEQKGQRASQSR